MLPFFDHVPVCISVFTAKYPQLVFGCGFIFDNALVTILTMLGS